MKPSDYSLVFTSPGGTSTSIGHYVVVSKSAWRPLANITVKKGEKTCCSLQLVFGVNYEGMFNAKGEFVKNDPFWGVVEKVTKVDLKMLGETTTSGFLILLEFPDPDDVTKSAQGVWEFRFV